MTTRIYGVNKSHLYTPDINLIGIPGTPGFGVGVCPPELLPDGMYPMPGYDNPLSDNYGNYQFQDGSICIWRPKYFYKITSGTNTIDIKGVDTYATEALANADGYAMPRSFIDGGVEQKGYFRDKYFCSKNAWGTGWIASSIKNGLPLSTHADHNPIADLTAVTTNNYASTLLAAAARDGVDGAVSATPKWQVESRFIQADSAIISLATAQAISNAQHCAWYDPTYNYPKGCNNDALKDYDEVTNGAGIGSQLTYVSDGYLNCGKTGSGVPFAKSTDNGQACGVADVNGLMWAIGLGVTCVGGSMNIVGASQANPCVITVADTALLSGHEWVMILSAAGMTELNDKLYKITVIDGTTFSLDGIDSSAYGAWTSGGTVTYGKFYVAKEATAMRDFTNGNSGATDHWGATGVAAMMDEIPQASLPFVAGGGFIQYYGNGANQMLDEATSGVGWLLTGLGLPQDSNGLSAAGTNEFGKDYFYQYIRNELCLLSGGPWNSNSAAGVWSVAWTNSRTHSNANASFRLALYPE